MKLNQSYLKIKAKKYGLENWQDLKEGIEDFKKRRIINLKTFSTYSHCLCRKVK